MNICSCLTFGVVMHLGCHWQSDASQCGQGTVQKSWDCTTEAHHCPWCHMVGSVFCGPVGGQSRVPSDTSQDQEHRRPLLKLHKCLTFIHFQITLELFKWFYWIIIYKTLYSLRCEIDIFAGASTWQKRYLPPSWIQVFLKLCNQSKQK